MIIHPARDFGPANFGHTVHRGRSRSDAAQIAFGQVYADEPIWIFLSDKGGCHIPRDEFRMIHHGGQEWQIVTNALNFEPVERDAHMLNRCAACGRPCAQLGDHRIVIHRNFAAFKNACVIAHGIVWRGYFQWRAVACETPNRWQEIAIGILGIKAVFN